MMGQYQLTMRTGPNPGTVYALEDEHIGIGRDASNDISVNDAEVSRRHARLTFQGGKFVLEDLGSTNGTYVNGQRLTGPRVLKSGEVISLGEQIVFVYESMSADPGKTVAAPRKAVSAQPQAQPFSPPPSPQDYAGSVPASPPPDSASPPFEPKKTNPVPIAIGVGVLLLICVCVVFFWYVDANYLWCTLFPFLGGC
jgi:pSer/pThr/pTyr-binding forkhead associated (FHA) protein